MNQDEFYFEVFKLVCLFVLIVLGLVAAALMLVFAADHVAGTYWALPFALFVVAVVFSVDRFDVRLNRVPRGRS